ncbi:alpha/beta hydrolase [Paenibacillus albidus]|uniref:alpha/beta hydrolase n=1 Tax=Paenibacillus albidus TaxID=2041023 RepID=UPI001BE62663|nr:alpha/beta hydrolase [Paenibacillus albidus]MBT2291767.1 alpha/beta hydrolase [Paenibacillus albidus]
MSVNYIVMPSHWGREVRHKHIQQGSKALAVIFPGKNYSADKPLLEYAAKVAREHGCDILLLEYGYQSARAELKREEVGIAAEECKGAIASLPMYDQFLFISKSIGTVIAGTVAEELGIQRKTAHLYLTPLPETLPLIRRSQGSVIYGSSDPMFSEQHSAEIAGHKGIRVYRMDDANHSLEVGSVNETLAILMVIINFYHEFFRDALQN